MELAHSFSFQAAPVPLPGELSFTLVVGPVPATLRSQALVSAPLALSLPLAIKRHCFALHHLVRAAGNARDVILCGIFSTSSNRYSVLMKNTL